jgi:hypothetical protein
LRQSCTPPEETHATCHLLLCLLLRPLYLLPLELALVLQQQQTQTQVEQLLEQTFHHLQHAASAPYHDDSTGAKSLSQYTKNYGSAGLCMSRIDGCLL